ncbi:MAG: hypothetical protein ACFCBU_11830, partial [Cyanophyceae cyanobacterium]
GEGADLTRFEVEGLEVEGLEVEGLEVEGLEVEGLEVEKFNFEGFYQRWLDWGESWLRRDGNRDRWEWQDYGTLDGQWDNLEKLLNWCETENRVEAFWRLWPWIKGYTTLEGRVALRKRWLRWAGNAFEEREEWAKAAATYFDLGFTYSSSDTPDSLAAAQAYFAQGWQWREHCSAQSQMDLIVNQCRLAIRQSREHEAYRWLEIGRQFIEEMADLEGETEGEQQPKERLQTQLGYYEGELNFKAGRLEEAERGYSQAREAAIAIKWERAAVLSEGWLGDIAFRQGRLEEAEKMLKRTIQKASNQGDRRCSALCQLTLAEVGRAKGSERRASTLAIEAFKGFRQLRMELEMEQTVDLIKTLNYKPANLSFLLEGDVD